MARVTSAAQLARLQRQRALRVNRSLQTTSEGLARFAHAQAVKLTSGTTKQATLDRLGNPFSRTPGRRRAAWPPLPINVQGGDVLRKWRVFRYVRGRGRVEWRLTNLSPHAAAVLSPTGTLRMRPRGFWKALHRITLPEARRRYRAAFRGMR